MPRKVAIVGSGPSGFFAAEALLKSGRPIRVDMYERLPAPHGLVRFGVAPDHPRTKTVIKVFDRTAGFPGFSFFGNVTVGRDVAIEELRIAYDAVLIATGAAGARPLSIPGASLPGHYSATEFVGWYNGHPDHRHHDIDLDCETAVVIGHGNVSADVSRILMKPPEQLSQTDIADSALRRLSASGIRRIFIVGRGGFADAKFGNEELAELCKVDGWTAHIAGGAAPAGAEPSTDEAIENCALFTDLPIEADGASKTLNFCFRQRPTIIRGDKRVEAICLQHTDSDAIQDIPCGLVISCIGFRSEPIGGVPFDPVRSIIPNEDGRIVGTRDLYVSGWIKRGPAGAIGTHRACSAQTIKTLLNDLPTEASSKLGFKFIEELLRERGIRATTYEDWKRLDRIEIERGQKTGKPREKILDPEEMLSLLEGEATLANVI